jgi:hypothetical protein
MRQSGDNVFPKTYVFRPPRANIVPSISVFLSRAARARPLRQFHHKKSATRTHSEEAAQCSQQTLFSLSSPVHVWLRLHGRAASGFEFLPISYLEFV